MVAVTAVKWVISLLCCLASAANTTCPKGGLTLLQKLNKVQRLTIEAESNLEWVAVDGGHDRACRGANAGDNKAEYFNVSNGLASLGTCQALCESNTNCKGVEFHSSGRCEIWTRAGGIESSVSLTGYSCYALQLPDFIPVDASFDRACDGDNEDMEAITVSSLAECKERCRSDVTCKGLGYLNPHCELWSTDMLATTSSAGSVCLQLEFAAVEGPDRACRGGSTTDNNPAHFSVASGVSSELECKQACRGHAACKAIEYSAGRCEVWTREGGIQATVPMEGFKCLAFFGVGTTTTSTAVELTEAERALFLIQATFGPTLASLQAMGQSSFKQWMEEQMKMPMESHREYYRKRANPYLMEYEDAEVDLTPFARARCEVGSRWVGYTFHKRDLGKSIQVNQNEIFVDGLKRTEIDPAYLGNGLEAPLSCADDVPEYWQSQGYTCQTLDRDSLEWTCDEEDWQDSCRQSCFDIGHTPGMDCSIGWPGLSFTGYICDVEGSEVGSWVQLATSSDCKTGLRAMLNPHVWQAAPNTEIESLNFSVFSKGVIHLRAAPAVCNLGTVVRSEAEGAERFYILEPRLRLVHNTLEEPASSSSWGGGACPAVTKSFLNEGSCKLLPGCLPLGTAQVQVLLDTPSFQQFFEVGGRYVFAIKGLRTSTSPCNRRSRWKQLDCSVESCSPSSLSTDDLAAVQGELSAAQGWLRDVDIDCGNVPAQAVVQVDSEHFQHTHLDEFNVYDFTDWVNAHPGGPEKITQWTNQGYELQYPSWHGMDRWDEGIAPGVLRPNLVGRYKESIEFQVLPQPLQTQALRNALATPSADSNEYSIVCGSPGEIPNDPILGHQLAMRHQGGQDWHHDVEYHSRWGTSTAAKSSVWTMHALYAQDQLRQRMAWALSQILVTAVAGSVAYGRETEMWMNYYDIFVRNAFGNFRDVLREVTYNPIMGGYLTFKRNWAFDNSNHYPDENFAREIMQLFTIGLWKLNPDGTRMKDGDGNDIPTYTNEHIMNFARVFTGFDEQPGRDNMEFVRGNNLIDPMRIYASRHDVYPKPDLDGNFLGDGYPLCSDLPPGYFLLRGAKYEFLGHTYAGTDVLSLNSSSQLHTKLCGGGAPCKHSLVVELAGDLNCSQGECDMDTVSVVNVSGGLYRYIPPACVNLFFFNGQVVRRGGRAYSWSGKCRDPNLPVGGTACCGGCTNKKDWWWLDSRRCSCENATTACPQLFTDRCRYHDGWAAGSKFCQLACWQNGAGYDGDDCSFGLWRGERACAYPMEFVRLKTAQKTCDKLGLQTCDVRLEGYGCGFDEEHVWTPETCSYEVIVYADGKVSSNYTSRTRQNRFYVPWKEGYPKQEAGACPTGCKTYGDGCSCSMTVETRSIFQSVPSGEELQSKAVRIGSYAAHIALTSSPGSVNVYGNLGEPETTFEYQGKFYKNKESVVKVGNFEFRNPPVFVTLEEPQERDAHLEVESLLDHLFYHPNTASFISLRLIQRFTSSNPSPGYVKAVADAFRTGAYEGTTLGAYGDLGATIMAILLHPEARSQTSATNGALREPLIKVMHVMRSLEYKDSASRNIFLQNLIPLIGQFPYYSPSVFNFYLPEFKPSSFPEGHFGPEFQILTPPAAIRFMNGLTNLIDRGLGPHNCGGFGFASSSNCSTGELHLHELDCVGPTVDQMDLLLTGGRLHDTEKIKAAYQSADGGREYKMAQMAMVLTPEFHTLGSSLPLGPRTPTPTVVAQEPRSYKALVMVYLSGGADTYNMLVPMNCPLYDEYTEVRGPIALAPGELHQIQVEGQPCTDFGVHTRLAVLKELYDSKEMAFLSNVGGLAEPLSKEQWESDAGLRCSGLFSHSDQKQGAQTLQCQQSASGEKGVGGRLADALASGSQKFRTMSLSVAGMSTWSQGKETVAEILDEQSGTVTFDQYERLKTVLDNITSVRHGNIYAEEFSSKFVDAITLNQELAAVLKDAKLRTSFPTHEMSLSRQLKQVARLMAARGPRGSERDVFYVDIGGFDTHSSVSRELNSRFDELNLALSSFVNELKAQDIFDSTTLVTHSDFGRTLTPNSGEGSDHAWGGNYFVLGGAVRGGHVYNDFPASLKEGGPQDAGRGRLIPKYPWENMMLPVAEWMGLDADQVASVFPNIAAFNSSLLLSSATLFMK